MANYFELIATLDGLIGQFESILTGNESAQVLTSSGYKPSLQKAVSDKLSYLQTLVQGALAYETYSLMTADSSQSPNVLARVWNDPNRDLNGLYGWNGAAWIRSPMDSVADVNSRLDFLPNQSSAIALENLYDDGLQSYQSDPSDTLTPVIKDNAGNVIIGIDSQGRVACDLEPSALIRSLTRVGGPELSDVDVSGTASEDLVFAVVDTSNTMGFAIKKNGDVVHKSADSNYGLKQFNLPILHHIVMDGQSQAAGQAAIPEITASSDGRYNWPFMPDGGVNDRSFSDLLPLSEVGYETPCSGFSLGILDAIEAPDGVFDWRIGVSDSGVGGTSIGLFNKNGSQYSRFFDHVLSMKDAADNNSLDYQLHGYAWLQGGTDMNNGTSYSDYKSDLIQLRIDRQVELSSALGIPNLDLHCFTWQNGARNWVDNIDVPNAQLDAANENDRIHMVCPSYFFEFIDTVHFTNVSSKWIGMYMGQAYKKVIFDGGEIKPLQPVSVVSSGQVIVIEYDVPHPPLEFDTDLLVDVGDQGFIVSDDVGVLGITNISISNGTNIEIEVDRVLSSNPKVSYGRKFTGSGSAKVGDHCRGHVRDSAGYTNIYKATNDGYHRDLPMHNWSVIFELQIN